MALNNIQEIVERSIFEAIRKVVVQEGYLPDVESYDLSTLAGQNQYQTAITNIAKGAMKFASEVFSNSSSQDKDLKRVPRIVIVPGRIIPGDIGWDLQGQFRKNPVDPNNYQKLTPAYQTSNFQLDIHLVVDTAQQDRVLNALMYKALGVKKFLPFYNDPSKVFFIHQYDYYDVPDTPEGITEKVYSYQVDDLMIYEGEFNAVPLITEITVETTLLDIESMVTAEGNIIGPYVDDSKMVIDLSGIKYI